MLHFWMGITCGLALCSRVVPFLVNTLLGQSSELTLSTCAAHGKRPEHVLLVYPLLRLEPHPVAPLGRAPLGRTTLGRPPATAPQALLPDTSLHCRRSLPLNRQKANATRVSISTTPEPHTSRSARTPRPRPHPHPTPPPLSLLD